MAYKSERSWSDFEKADKVMFFIMLTIGLGLMAGVGYNNAVNVKSNVVKTAMVGNGR